MPARDPTEPMPPPEQQRMGATSDELLFRDYYRDRNLPVTRTGLAFAVLLISAVCALDYNSMDQAHGEKVVPLRLGLMLAPMLIALIISWISAWRRYVSMAVTAAGFLCGIGTFSDSFVSALMDQPVVLWGNIFFTFYVYLVLGLSFRASVIAASPILLISVGFGAVYDTPIHKIAYVVFSQMIGMYTSYRLEQDAREIYHNTLELEAISRTDVLTSIANRRHFDEFAARAWRQAYRDRKSIGLLLVDIDYFKFFNDTQGHQAGDECIRTIGKELAFAANRPLDLVARYGGEEFAVILYDPSADYLASIGETLRTRIKDLNISHAASEVSDRVTVSVGAGRFHPDGKMMLQPAMERVDSALYAAKAQGRDRVVLTPEDVAPHWESSVVGSE
ncbi:MAG: GGDEF domain-containing protein [Pseudomonadales bacterium]